MTISQAQRWLAVYFLLITACIGVFIIIFPNTNIFPVSGDEAQASFKILIPVLIGQLTIIFQWFGRAANTRDDRPSPVPDWTIRLPAAISAGAIIFCVIALVVMNAVKFSGQTQNIFSNVVTLAVSILNASTVFLVARLFPHQQGNSVGQHGNRNTAGSDANVASIRPDDPGRQ